MTPSLRRRVFNVAAAIDDTHGMPWIPPAPSWSLAEPPSGVEVATDLIRLAVDAVDAGRLPVARSLLRALDWTAFEMYWDEAGLENGRRHDKTAHRKGIGTKGRAIPRSTKLVVANRDGWRCRYCGLRVVSAPVLKSLQARFPALLPLAQRAVDEHPAHRVLRCTQDHLEAHAAGGSNRPDNLVTSCGACNFQKGDCSLDELSLRHPLSREPILDDWDGLSGRLKTVPI